MKTSTLKQKINRLLKFLGIRIVLFKRARKPRAAKAIIAALNENHEGRVARNMKALEDYKKCLGLDSQPYRVEDLTDTCERPRVEQPTTKDTTGPTS